MLVFICSPYRAETPKEVEKNVELARRLCREAVSRGETPMAPHLLFPQFLDDSNEEERTMGLLAAMDLLALCSTVYVYEHRITDGMLQEIQRAKLWNKHIVFTE